jgi:hypothetical protein
MGAWPNRCGPVHFQRAYLRADKNREESCGQLRSEAVHDGDDRNRDAGGDAVTFDDGRSCVVVEKVR